MSAVRVPFRWSCSVCDEPHVTDAWTTTTPGLVVNRSLCPVTGNPDDGEWWAVSHFVSGLGLPRWFDSPEHAMACASQLGSLDWDWTRCEKPTGVVTEVVSLLVKFGGTYEPYGTHSGDIEVRNPEAVTQ